MKKARTPKLIIRQLMVSETGLKGPGGDDPITTSGTICTLIGKL